MNKVCIISFIFDLSYSTNQDIAGIMFKNTVLIKKKNNKQYLKSTNTWTDNHIRIFFRELYKGSSNKLYKLHKALMIISLEEYNCKIKTQ